METTFTCIFLILLHFIQVLKKFRKHHFDRIQQPVEVQWKEFNFFKWDFALVSDTTFDTGLLLLGYHQSASLLALLTWVIGSLENPSWNPYSIWKFILHNKYIYSDPFENLLEVLVHGLGYYLWWQENNAVVKGWQDEEVWCYFMAHFLHSITLCSPKTVGHSLRVFQLWGVFFFSSWKLRIKILCNCHLK